MLLGLILFLITMAGCILFRRETRRLVPSPGIDLAEALAWDHQFTWTLWITGIIFIAAQLLLAWTIIRGRKRLTASSTTGHRHLELTWIAAAAALFISLSILGSRGWAKVPTASPGK